MAGRRGRRLNKVAFFRRPTWAMCWGFGFCSEHRIELFEVTGAVEIGTLQLPSGGMIGVCMRPDPLTPQLAMKIREVRTQMLNAVGARGNQAFTWGRFDNGAVCLLDPGVVEPESAAPNGTAQAGPG